MVIAPPFASNIENFWDEPDFAQWLERLGRFAHVALFDKRGTGMSDRLGELPGLETRIDDFKAVMDALDLRRSDFTLTLACCSLQLSLSYGFRVIDSMDSD